MSRNALLEAQMTINKSLMPSLQMGGYASDQLALPMPVKGEAVGQQMDQLGGYTTYTSEGENKSYQNIFNQIIGGTWPGLASRLSLPQNPMPNTGPFRYTPPMELNPKNAKTSKAYEFDFGNRQIDLPAVNARRI